MFRRSARLLGLSSATFINCSTQFFNPSAALHTSSSSMSFTVKPYEDIQVIPVPCFSDNYAYIIRDVTAGKAALVDPVEPNKVKTALDLAKISLTDVDMILTTHKHWDHSSGNKKMHALVPQATIYMGPEQGDFDFPMTVVKEGDKLSLGSISIDVLLTPCHTSGHVCYYLTKGEEHLIFTGDTLFVGGCGRFFEGDASSMYANMQKFRALPPHTHVYTGHEYTSGNLRFAASVDPTNADIASKLAWAKVTPNTHPSTIAQELATNVFLRAGSVEDLGKLRDKKDNFRG